LLCEAFWSANRVLSYIDKELTQELKLLREAVYGSDKKNALINVSGHVTPSLRCGYPLNGRTPLCTYYRGHPGTVVGLRKDGCFAESLFGTFLCICTPGEEQLPVRNLCRVAGLEYGDKWSGKWGRRGLEDKKTLFGKVLGSVMKACTEESRGEQDDSNGLEKLEKSVNNIKKKLKPGKREGFSYLGGSDNVIECSGVNGQDVCVAHQRGVDEARIPWVEKIEEVLDQLKPVFHRLSTMKASIQAPVASYTQGTAGQPEAPREAGEMIYRRYIHNTFKKYPLSRLERGRRKLKRPGFREAQNLQQSRGKQITKKTTPQPTSGTFPLTPTKAALQKTSHSCFSLPPYTTKQKNFFTSSVLVSPFHHDCQLISLQFTSSQHNHFTSILSLELGGVRNRNRR
ncbi:Variant surface glycoprotein, partial [Trypanosoma congolense IL3000]